MQIDPARVTMEVRTDWTAAGEHPLGRYNSGNPAHIEVNPSQLHDPESLAATLAHELAHEILLGGGLLNDNNEDLERLTDLLPIFLGIGIFGANSGLREQNFRVGRFSWWSMQKQGTSPSECTPMDWRCLPGSARSLPQRGQATCGSMFASRYTRGSVI